MKKREDSSRDEVEISGAQAEDAVRSLKDTLDEEAKEDRREQDGYRPVTRDPADGDDRPRIDVQG